MVAYGCMVACTKGGGGGVAVWGDRVSYRIFPVSRSIFTMAAASVGVASWGPRPITLRVKNVPLDSLRLLW